MATKSIKGAQIQATGGRPANLHSPTHFISGSPKKVGNVKGGPDLGGRGGSEYFMKSQASGPKKIVEAKGFHLA